MKTFSDFFAALPQEHHLTCELNQRYHRLDLLFAAANAHKKIEIIKVRVATGSHSGRLLLHRTPPAHSSINGEMVVIQRIRQDRKLLAKALDITANWRLRSRDLYQPAGYRNDRTVQLILSRQS